MMKIFVLHYSKLSERKTHILSQFKKHNILDYEFVETYDKDSLTDADKVLFQPNYKLSMISLTLKHFWVYKEISDKYECALILENDVILSDNFTKILNNYLTQLPKDYDMLFIGDGCNLHIEKHNLRPNKYIYPKCLHATKWGGMGSSRCSDSYIISKKCSIALCNYLSNLNYKINIPSDWWLNVASRDNNFNVYWCEPTIVTQGTQIGKFASSHT